MKDYLNKINNEYPIRRTKKQKNEFINYVKNQFEIVNVDQINQHKNIIIGNFDNAKIILTAHYDTPAKSLFPNLVIPRCFILNLIYQLFFIGIFFGISCLASFILKYMFNLTYEVWYFLFLSMYFVLFFIATMTFTNKHNFNDNTSGVATVLEIIKTTQKNDICVVLFDNEEKGLLGSKAFNKKYKNIVDEKLIINFDCVGNGNNILVACKKEAMNNQYLALLKECVVSNNKYNVMYFDSKKIFGSTDYKNFKQSISFMAYNKNKIIGYYTSRIHTSKDTVVDSENIKFLTDNIIKVFEKI